MATRLQVLAAVKALVQAAVPAADVRGMSTDEAKPVEVGPDGMVIVRSGDPGQPDIDLSPPAYNYDHTIPIELGAYSKDVLIAMIVAIGASILADRHLGGLCTWLDAEAPTDGESDSSGASPMGWAEFPIIASYTTSNPLA